MKMNHTKKVVPCGTQGCWVLAGSSSHRKKEDMLGDPPSNAAAHRVGCGSIATSRTISCVLTTFSGKGSPGSPICPCYWATCPHSPGATPHHIQLSQLITSRVIPSSFLLSLSLPHPSNQLPYSLHNLSICVHPQPFPGLAAVISRVTTMPFLLWSCSTQAPIHPLAEGASMTPAHLAPALSLPGAAVP